MSGGHFNYQQHAITDVAESIKKLIKNEQSNELDNYGYPVAYGFSKETIDEFAQAVLLLEKAAIYAQRIDWLVSGDDGEGCFHRRLKEELTDNN